MAAGIRVGVLVNDMAEVNVDAATIREEKEMLLKSNAAQAQGMGAPAVVVHQEMVEFSGGCICCTLRADFVRQLAEMAAATEPLPAGSKALGGARRRFDYLVVESSGIR